MGFGFRVLGFGFRVSGVQIVNPFTKYALTMTPVALCLEELLPMDPKLPSYRRASLAIRTALVASTVCVALLIPFFGYVMAFIGSFLSMTVVRGRLRDSTAKP